MGSAERLAFDEQSVNLLSTALVSGKVVDRYDMKWAERESQRKSKSLIDILVELELVTPLQLQTCFESLKRNGRLSG